MTTATGISYTFTPTAGCTNASQTFYFKVASTTTGVASNDVSVTVVTATGNFLTASNPYVFLTCSGSTPGSPVTVTLKAAATVPTAFTLTPSLPANPTGVVVALATGSASAITPAMTTLTGVSYTFTPAAACANFTSNSQTFTFKAATTGAAASDVAVTVLTNPPSSLIANPITLTCTKDSSNSYSGLGSTTLTVSSNSSDPAALTYTPTSASIPGWLLFSGSGSSQTAPHTHTVGINTGCGGFPLNSSNVANVHLSNSPYPDKIVQVTLVIVSPSTLVVPSPVSVKYTQKSGTPGLADVAVGGPSGLFFTVDTTTLPIWLTVDYASGITPKTIRFTTTNGADLLPPGPYTKAVHIRVTGQADAIITFNLQLNSPAPHLTVSSYQPSTSWTIGNPVLPTAMITLVSTGAAIPYSIATGGALQPAISKTLASGLAYGFATEIPVTFSPAAFASAEANTTLNGIASITWGSPAVISVVSFTVNVQSPSATLNAIYPQSLAAARPGTTYTLNLTGTGFVQSADPNVRTHVGISNAAGSSYAESPAFTVTVIDTAHISLGIVVPQTGTVSLPFDTTGSAQVILSVCNPIGGVCSVANPGSTAAFTIGSIPTINTVTSAAAFLQGASVAPYDIISLFGFNFCPTCTSVVQASPDANLIYPTTLSDGQNNPTLLKVTFKNHSGNLAAIPDTDAHLLFATNNQINLLVPQVVSTVTGTVDIVVTFGAQSSQIYPVTVGTADPGIFTVGSDGQGDGAILDTTYAIVNSANPAGVRKGADSDIVSIYMSGLGVPTAAGVANAADNSSIQHWSTDCISATSYVAVLNNAVNGSIAGVDGAVIQSSLLDAKRLPPCMTNTTGDTSPTVTVGGVAATVNYAGWVADSVAGLYQVNVQLPDISTATLDPGDGTGAGAVTAAKRYPVVVSLGSGQSASTSQNGVMIALVPRLQVNAPSSATGSVGTPWAGTNVTAGEGQSPYHYVLTSGVLPLGLTFHGDGSITGTPALGTAGYYYPTVTVTDSATIPVTGTVTFPLIVNGGLVMSLTGSSPFAATFGTPVNSVTQISAAGGVTAYTYSISAPASLPAGLTIDSNTGVVSTTALTPAGSYNITVHAVDNTTGTHLVGNISFVLNVAIQFDAVVPATQTVGNQTAVLATVTGHTGNTGGTIVYTLDQASQNAGFTISGGSVKVGTAQVVGSWPVVVTATDSGTMAPNSAAFAQTNVGFNVAVASIPTLVVTAPAAATPIDKTAGGTIPIVVTGGTAPYITYAITGNANGCSFADPSAGTLTVPGGGTPGSFFQITVTVTDSKGITAFVTFTVTYTS